MTTTAAFIVTLSTDGFNETTRTVDAYNSIEACNLAEALVPGSISLSWAFAPTIEQAAAQAIELAARCSTWGAMASSAALCLDDAVSLINRGQHAYAYARALDSLRYSVSIFGEAYKAAKALQA